MAAGAEIIRRRKRAEGHSNLKNIMWYLGSLLIVLVSLAACAVIGQPLVDCLPYRLRPGARLFLSPLLGLAVLVLVATLTGWCGHGYRQWLCLTILSGLAALGGWRRRRRNGAGGYFSRLTVFGVLASLPALASVLRRGGFNTQNDAFMYLVQAQWLQDHGFRQPVHEPSLHPALTMITLFQNQGLRMGTSFWLGWLQSAFGLAWSLDAYPAVTAIGSVVGALAIGAGVLAVFPHRRTEAWLCALAAASTLNGFSFGPIAGFLAQTYGLAFAAGVFVLRGMEVGAARRGGPSGGWRGVLPQALCLACAILCYSEMAPFLLAGLGLSYLLPWPGQASGQTIRSQLWGRGRQAGKLAGLTLLLTNLEWVRLFHAIRFQMHLVPGGPVDWRWWEFPAHALGFRSADGNPGYYAVAGLAVLPALVATILLAVWLQGRQPPRPGLGPRWIALWPTAGVTLVYAAAFVAFRYLMHSPWPDRPGLRHLVGQTFLQLRVTHWSSPALLLCFTAAVVNLGQRDRWIGRKVVIGFLALWCACGLAANYQLGANRSDVDLASTGQNHDPFTVYVNLREALARTPASDVIYLDMDQPEDYVSRQLVAYYLQERRVASDWKTDSYINPWLPRDQPTPPPRQCQWILSRITAEGAPPSPGYLTVRSPLQNTFFLVQADTPYGRETDGQTWWYWTGNRLRFRYRLAGLSAGHVRVSFDYHPVTLDRTLVIHLAGEGIEQAFETQMLPGDHRYTTQTLAWRGEKLDLELSCPQPPVQGAAPDTREFSYRITNLAV